jgi:hypothetical protein
LNNDLASESHSLRQWNVAEAVIFQGVRRRQRHRPFGDLDPAEKARSAASTRAVDLDACVCDGVE